MFKNTVERWGESMMRPINTNIISLLGFSTILWGIWIANPFWTVFDKSSAFDHMHFMGESAWGIIAIACGLLTLRGAFKPSYQNLHIGSFAAAIQWLAVSAGWLTGDWQNPAWIFSLTFCVYASVVSLNIFVNKHLYI